LSEYKVLFTPACRQKLNEFGPSAPVNEALETVIRDLSSNPFAFGSVEILDDRGAASKVRFAKTALFLGESGFVPPLVLFFGIVEGRKQVYVVDVTQGSGFGLKP